jgi:hypothetical protein
MQTITYTELLNYLAPQTDEIPVILQMKSPLKLKKTGNPFADKTIYKLQTIGGVIGKKYADEVEKYANQNDQPTPLPKERAWGVLINPYIVKHNESYYLQIFVDATFPATYELDGNIIDKSLIQDYFPTRTEQTINVKDIKFDNIQYITINNQEFKLIK